MAHCVARPILRMRITPTVKPVLSGRKAALVFLSSALLTAAPFRLVQELGWHEQQINFWLGAYYIGHMVLAIILARGRLRLDFPVSRCWLDFLIVIGAPWLGPIAWYREWKKIQGKAKGLHPHNEQPQQGV